MDNNNKNTTRARLVMMTAGRNCVPVAPDVVLLLTEGGLVDVDAAVVEIAMSTSGLGPVVGLAVAVFL
jgi:hypothetical protein